MPHKEFGKGMKGKAPKGMHKMPDGRMMKDSEMPMKGKMPTKGKGGRKY